jgi:hypothetical protein
MEKEIQSKEFLARIDRIVLEVNGQPKRDKVNTQHLGVWAS